LIIIKKKGKDDEKEDGGNCSAALGNQLQHGETSSQKYEVLAVPLD
jgi:hypothetical protein